MLHHEYTNKNLTKVIFFHKKFKIIHDKTKKQNVYLFLPPYQSSMRIHGKFRPQKQIHCQQPSLLNSMAKPINSESSKLCENTRACLDPQLKITAKLLLI